MSLFEHTVAIDHAEVKAIVREHWNLELGDIIKASQNHTFKATSSENQTSFAVRVTPDPSDKHLQRIRREVQFVRFVADHGVHLYHVCGPVKTASGEFFVKVGDLIIVVFEWAKGEPLGFLEYQWMTDREVVFAWGQWLARLHQISRQFSEKFPDVAMGVQKWDEMHNGILAGSQVHADDQAVVDDLQHYGVLHGDLNCSNFYWIAEEKALSVYDWDQTQRGWYLWDVAQSELTAYMLSEAGSVVDGSEVLQADPVAFETWIVEGYESIAGVGSVDRARLKRMVDLRKSFYERFCRKAQAEGDIPKDMEHFINYVVNWFDKLKNNKL